MDELIDVFVDGVISALPWQAYVCMLIAIGAILFAVWLAQAH